ncbi:hypothetical protein [Burkholderia cepacia]|uniref:hypothetical protein n=1 Tax=Burkholderia cepacia TaxID=292 RepID=UPI000A420743|nr:hypothetical protein [Burkholderia cepacia]
MSYKILVIFTIAALAYVGYVGFLSDEVDKQQPIQDSRFLDTEQSASAPIVEK